MMIGVAQNKGYNKNGHIIYLLFFFWERPKGPKGAWAGLCQAAPERAKAGLCRGPSGYGVYLCFVISI